MFIKKFTNNSSLFILVYIAIIICFYGYSDNYKFFPKLSGFFLDYKHSIDFPDYWDSDPSFYSILPFDTVICLFLRALNATNLNYLLVIVPFAYAHAVYLFLTEIKEKKYVISLPLILTLITIPNLLGIYSGHFAVIYTVLVFYWAYALVSQNKFLSSILSIVIVSMKFNFMPLLLVNHIYEDKNIFRLDVIKSLTIKFLCFIITQILCFFLVRNYYEDYSIQKIIYSFAAYGNGYIQGLGGLDFRYWLGSIYKISIFMTGISSTSAAILILLSYAYFLISGIYIYIREERSVRIFIFIFMLLYLNLSTTAYWYTIFSPFFLYFLLSQWRNTPELCLLMILFYPKPILSGNYMLYDNILTYMSVLLYFFWRTAVCYFFSQENNANKCLQ